MSTFLFSARNTAHNEKCTLERREDLDNIRLSEDPYRAPILHDNEAPDIPFLETSYHFKELN